MEAMALHNVAAAAKCAGYSPAFDRFCVMAQEGVMEFCGNPIF
jgi:hypothetical protein